LASLRFLTRSSARIFLGILAGAILLVICNTASLLIKIYA
jgi:hypothetical protein